jgi:hemin uptake protein HemP
MNSDEQKPSQGGGNLRDRPSPTVRRWLLTDLLGDGRETIIEHAGETYRLRLTANNKVILTK